MALGTTKAKAGSQEAFRYVDYTLPLIFAKAAHSVGVETFALVSCHCGGIARFSFCSEAWLPLDLCRRDELGDSRQLRGTPPQNREAVCRDRPTVMMGCLYHPEGWLLFGSKIKVVTYLSPQGQLKKAASGHKPSRQENDKIRRNRQDGHARLAYSASHMANVSTRITTDKQTPGYWRVTLNHPPINTIDDLMYDEFYDLVEEIETKPSLKVVTFGSANPDYFIAHYGVAESSGRFGKARWIDAAIKLSRSSVLSIAVIRGRTRAGGNEFALACDMRFASREKAILGQPEVGFGLIPGGGGLQRLPLFVTQ